MPELRSSKLQELQGSNSEATCANVFEQGNLQLDKGTVHQVPTNFCPGVAEQLKGSSEGDLSALGSYCLAPRQMRTDPSPATIAAHTKQDSLNIQFQPQAAH